MSAPFFLTDSLTSHTPHLWSDLAVARASSKYFHLWPDLEVVRCEPEVRGVISLTITWHNGGKNQGSQHICYQPWALSRCPVLNSSVFLRGVKSQKQTSLEWEAASRRGAMTLDFIKYLRHSGTGGLTQSVRCEDDRQQLSICKVWVRNMRTAACQAVTITAISSTQATQHGSRAPREAPRNSSQCVHHSVMNKHTLQTLTFRPLYGPC